ncbi:MAG: 2Fe-2S iron-sulfur cluster-binding protein [Pyrinomonadaceae bacterium]
MELEDIKDVFQPYDRLVEIEICGETREVPENNTILRCFQFLAVDTISYGDFCWNGDCLNCQVWIDNDGKEKGLIACRTNVAEGMKIVRMADFIDLSNE